MRAGMPEVTRLQVRAADGRQLDVELSGTGDRYVLTHTGTPSSRELFDSMIADGSARGLRHIAYSRPGYGHSDRHEGRTVADCTDDVVAILDALESCLSASVEGMSQATGEAIRSEFGDLLTPVDAAVLSGSSADHMALTTRNAFTFGLWGWFDDDIACVNDWRFELAAIGQPVAVWQGREDRFVPPAHADWLASHVPGARLELRADEGHLSLAVATYGEVLDALVRDDATHSPT
jgi:pimeloyl-ACP methyl ester carboxylesterase